jgi:hypothetical protein
VSYGSLKADLRNSSYFVYDLHGCNVSIINNCFLFLPYAAPLKIERFWTKERVQEYLDALSHSEKFKNGCSRVVEWHNDLENKGEGCKWVEVGGCEETSWVDNGEYSEMSLLQEEVCRLMQTYDPPHRCPPIFTLHNAIVLTLKDPGTVLRHIEIMWMQ